MKLINTLLIIVILFSTGCNQQSSEHGASNGLAAATLSGCIMKNKNIDPENKKYKRKDCPVCKGKGWYMSGDGIEKIPCQYCEPESTPEPEKQSSIIIRRR